MTRRQIHTYGLTGLLLLAAALGIALAMLAHATMSGSAQWAAGAFFGALVLLLVAGFVALVVGAGLVGDEIESRRRARARRLPVRTAGQAAAIRQRRDERRAAVIVDAVLTPDLPPVDPETYARDRALIEGYGRPAGRRGAPHVPMSARPDPDPQTRIDPAPAPTRQQRRIEVWQAPASDTAANADRYYAHPGRTA